MKQRIKIFFTDFWNTFKVEDNFFIDHLKDDFDVVIDDVNPDFVFYSNFGIDYYKYKCIRIYFTGENIRPNFNECDWAFTFDYSEDTRNYRLPLYALFADMNELTQSRDVERFLSEKTKFCNFIYSNPGASKRREFFYKLSEYKRVDSAGRYLNNIGGPIGGFEKEKKAFIRNYKFTFAFENSSYLGYTTEKILDPLLCGSIPLYWGNKDVAKDFNPKSFLNYHDYENDEEFLAKIIEYDTNHNLYAEMLAQPPFTNNQINEFVKTENIKKRLKYIIEQDITPIALSSPIFSDNKVKSVLSLYNTRLKYYKKLIENKISIFSLDRLTVKAHRIKENLKK